MNKNTESRSSIEPLSFFLRKDLNVCMTRSASPFVAVQGDMEQKCCVEFYSAA